MVAEALLTPLDDRLQIPFTPGSSLDSFWKIGWEAELFDKLAWIARLMFAAYGEPSLRRSWSHLYKAI